MNVKAECKEIEMHGSRNDAFKSKASFCETSGVLLSSSRGTSRRQHELQLTSVWPGMRRSSQLLSGDIHRRTRLTSAVYDIQPFPQQQCARSGQYIATAY